MKRGCLAGQDGTETQGEADVIETSSNKQMVTLVIETCETRSVRLCTSASQVCAH